MYATPAANDPSGHHDQVCLEQTCLLRGRPCVVLTWFARPEPEVGLVRPQLVAALAVDPDGEVYEDLDRAEVGGVIEQLRERAASILEG